MAVKRAETKGLPLQYVSSPNARGSLRAWWVRERGNPEEPGGGVDERISDSKGIPLFMFVKDGSPSTRGVRGGGV